MALTAPPRNLREIMSTPVLPNREWIGNGYLMRGGKTIIGSSSKAGKSFVALQLAKDLLFGGYAYDHPDLPILGEPRVLYIDQELGPEPLKKRLQGILAGSNWEKLDDSRLWTVSREPGLKLDTYAGLGLLNRLIEDLKPNVVILDPLAKFLAGDENSNTEVGAFVANLDTLLKQYAELDLSFVLLHHTGKIPRDSSVREKTDFLSHYALRGAGKIGDDVDAIHMMKRGDRMNPGWSNRCSLTLRHAEDIGNFDLVINHWRQGAVYRPITPEP